VHGRQARGLAGERHLVEHERAGDDVERARSAVESGVRGEADPTVDALPGPGGLSRGDRERLGIRVEAGDQRAGNSARHADGQRPGAAADVSSVVGFAAATASITAPRQRRSRVKTRSAAS